MQKFRFYLPKQDETQKHRVAACTALVNDPDYGPVKIVGITLWSRKDGKPGGITVTFPAERRPKDGARPGEFEYHEFIRPADDRGLGIKTLRAEIVKAFTKEYPAAALKATAGVGGGDGGGDKSGVPAGP